MVFLNDWCSPWLFGASVNQQTGKMTVLWAMNGAHMGDYAVMIGPKQHRVFVTQVLNHPTLTEMFQENLNYTEHLAWVDENTGKVLAETGSYPATTTGSLVNVGYAGRIYMMGNNGFLYIWYPVPCSKMTIPTNPPSATTCSGPEPEVPPVTDNFQLPQPQPAPPSP